MNDLYDILGFSLTLIDTEDYCDIKRYCADWVEGDPPSICTDAIGRCAESLVDMTASYTF